jgi:hypothetical protein
MAFLLVPDTPNVSLVAFYGKKPEAFQLFLESLQQRLVNLLSSNFKSYPIEQIHATVIGCEGLKTNQGILNKWFLEHRAEERYFNLGDFLTYLRESDRLPIKVRIGGYHLDINYEILSQGKHPFERSFQILGNTVVLRGWSFQDRKITLALNRFRLACQDFNLLHKYHQQADSIDNDLYMRIGFLRETLSDLEREEIEQKIRYELSYIAPVELLIDLETLKFIGYQDLSPSIDTTKVITLKDANLKDIKALFPV